MLVNEKLDPQKQQLKPIKVLIADDDPPTRILLRAAIAKWGYDALVASDGEEAWEILQKPDEPHLLILDWIMPKLDGPELCNRIRSQLKFHPYIILLTQVAGVTNIIAGLEAGADEFLSKPFNMAELRSRLSVGARIIQYENKVAEQNSQLQESISQMKTLSNLAEQALKKTDDLNPQNINELKNDLTKMIEKIETIKNMLHANKS